MREKVDGGNPEATNAYSFINGSIASKERETTQKKIKKTKTQRANKKQNENPSKEQPIGRVVRRSPRDRKFWYNLENVRRELNEFWVQQGVTKSIDPERPPIPPVGVVLVLERHDLLRAFTVHGGRKRLAEKLNVEVIDGSIWSAAVKNYPAMQALVENTTNPFSLDKEPFKILREYQDGNALHHHTTKIQRKKRPEKRIHGYWTNLENVKHELVQFWMNLGVTESLDRSKPPVPPYSLMKFLKSYYLASQITHRYGGAKALSKTLGVEHISGSWRKAVKKSKVLQELVTKNPNVFHSEVAPNGRFKFDGTKVVRKNMEPMVASAPLQRDVKYPGFWEDVDNVRRELYEFWVHEGLSEWVTAEKPPVPPYFFVFATNQTHLVMAFDLHGGREELGKKLDACVLAGNDWRLAFESSEVLQAWAQNKTHQVQIPESTLNSLQTTLSTQKTKNK